MEKNVAEQITEVEKQLEKYKESQDSTAPVVIAALEAELQKLKELQDATPATPEQEEDTADLDQTPDSAIPADVVAELSAIFNATMSNPEFFTKDNRVVALRNALKVPVSDDRSYQQCFIHAKNTLKSDAAELSFTTGKVVVMPSEEQIHALALENFKKKQAEKEAKAAKKKAA